MRLTGQFRQVGAACLFQTINSYLKDLRCLSYHGIVSGLLEEEVKFYGNGQICWAARL